MIWAAARSRPINDPEAKTLLACSQGKNKGAIKKEIVACGNDASMEIRKKRGFPQRLGKAFGFPTFPQGPTGIDSFMVEGTHLRSIENWS